jgi:predicted RNase H-like HicB family nuclease
MMDMDQEQLISSMLSYAEQNPSVTLTDYLNDGFGYESEDDTSLNEEGGNDWWVKADEELGLDFDGENLEDLAMNADESWQAAFAEKALAINSDNYEDYKDQISAIYDKTNPF